MVSPGKDTGFGELIDPVKTDPEIPVVDGGEGDNSSANSSVRRVRVPRVGMAAREAFGLPPAIGDPGLWIELKPGEAAPEETLPDEC